MEETKDWTERKKWRYMPSKKFIWQRNQDWEIQTCTQLYNNVCFHCVHISWKFGNFKFIGIKIKFLKKALRFQAHINESAPLNTQSVYIIICVIFAEEKKRQQIMEYWKLKMCWNSISLWSKRLSLSCI